MIKKILLAVAVVVVAAGAWVVYLMGSAGQFKTLEPHFDGECKPVSGISGPEDITIHPHTGIAYISAADRRAVIRGEPARGGIYAYDLNVGSPQLLHLTKDAAEDFHPHGISLYVGPEGRDSLMVVNHENDRHAIEIYDLGEGKLHHRTTITDPMLVSPNDIAAVGPDRFYVTNDHRYTGGLGQMLENYLRLRLSNVVYYNGSSFSEAASGIGYANGINVSSDGKTLYLCSVTEGALHIYRRDIITGNLAFQQKLDSGTGLDNLEMDSEGGLWIAAHPQLLTFVQHARNSAKISPSQILHLTPDTAGGFKINEIYLNLGEEISASSVAAVYGNRMLIGAVFDPKFMDCQW